MEGAAGPPDVPAVWAQVPVSSRPSGCKDARQERCDGGPGWQVGPGGQCDLEDRKAPIMSSACCFPELASWRGSCDCRTSRQRASPVVQWLRLCTPSAGGLGSIPSQGTRSHTQLKV